ncbi:Uncharacterised protein [Vibrio cholerae]|nr:Uncharacterised protein [Vibrio cholerae]CSC61747.1 Uncharacterised protein [Vibrio cholerae]
MRPSAMLPVTALKAGKTMLNAAARMANHEASKRWD